MSALRRRYAEDHFPHTFEIVILFLIFLAICHLCVEELAILLSWDDAIHRNLILGAFAFDLIFSLEFIARSIISLKEQRFGLYFMRQRGWVDFISSVPLALLVSGPAVAMLLLSPDGQFEHLPQYMVLLKTAKAVRVTRALRLIRMLRIFGRVQFTESHMTNHHVAVVATITVTTLILSLFVIQIMPYSPVPGHTAYAANVRTDLNQYLSGGGANTYEKPDPVLFERAFPSVIQLKTSDGQLVYQRPEPAPGWSLVSRINLLDGFQAEISYHRADANLALLILCLLAIILTLLVLYVILYGKVFVQTVAEPAYMMDRGLRQWNYNLSIPEDPYRPSDELSRLARIYNLRWLPLKGRIVDHYKKKYPNADIDRRDHGQPLRPGKAVSLDELI